jgi:hypothetical protein
VRDQRSLPRGLSASLVIRQPVYRIFGARQINISASFDLSATIALEMTPAPA